MKPSSIKIAKAECERFLATLRKLEKGGTHSEYRKGEVDAPFEGRKLVAAVKRASLDLQSVLTDLRMGRV